MIHKIDTFEDDRGRIVYRQELHGFASVAEVEAQDAAQVALEVEYPRFLTPVSLRLADPQGRPVAVVEEKLVIPDVDTPEEAFAFLDSEDFQPAVEALAKACLEKAQRKQKAAAGGLIVPRPGGFNGRLTS